MHFVITRQTLRRVTLWPLLAAALGGGLALLATTALAGTAGAQSATYGATLSGNSVVPAVTTDAGGAFAATLGAESLTFSLSADAQGVTQAHIHQGPAGGNGGVVAFLFGPADPAVDGVDTSGTVGPADLIGALAGNWDGFAADLAAGNLYVQVHTTANPPGALRGQIAATAGALPATGSGGLAGIDANIAGGSPAWAWGRGLAGSVLLAGVALRAAQLRRSR